MTHRSFVISPVPDPNLRSQTDKSQMRFASNHADVSVLLKETIGPPAAPVREGRMKKQRRDVENSGYTRGGERGKDKRCLLALALDDFRLKYPAITRITLRAR